MTIPSNKTCLQMVKNGHETMNGCKAERIETINGNREITCNKLVTGNWLQAVCHFKDQILFEIALT